MKSLNEDAFQVWRLDGSGMLCASALQATQPVREEVLPFSSGFYRGLQILMLIARLRLSAGCHWPLQKKGAHQEKHSIKPLM